MHAPQRGGAIESYPRIFIAAGEVSGDRQAAYLARAILSHNRHVQLYGSGGEKMIEAGIEIRVRTSHLGCVGFQEALRYLHPLRRVMSEIRSMIRSDPPDMAVLVDNEGFNGLLSRFLHSEGIPFIYYFPPQVWFWGEWRARAVATRAHAIIAAFADEAAIYRREGGQVRWFGHPLIDIVKTEPGAGKIFDSLGMDSARRTIAIMPGSRFQELHQMVPAMLGAAQILLTKHPELQIILPLAAPHLRSALEKQIMRAGMSGLVTVVEDHIYTLLSKCEMVLLSSGTATLELALLGIPMVVAYRVKPLTYLLGKHLLKVRFLSMPNILLGERAVPELLQEDVTAERLALEAISILDRPERANTIREKLGTIRSMLGERGVLDRAASFILNEVTQIRERNRLEVA